MSSSTARIAALLATLAAAACLPSCSRPDSVGHTQAASKDQPVITDAPAGYNADDVAFAESSIRNGKQGIDISALVPDHSTNPKVAAFASNRAAALQSDTAILRVFLVQWNENPDTRMGGSGHGTTVKGLIDQPTIARLASSYGREFDTLWLQSMIGLDQGAVEIANAEIVNGKHIDAVDLAKQIVKTQQAEIGQMKQLLVG